MVAVLKQSKAVAEVEMSTMTAANGKQPTAADRGERRWLWEERMDGGGIWDRVELS